MRLGRNRSIVGNHHFPVIPLYTDDKDSHDSDEKTSRSYLSTTEEYNRSQSQSSSQSQPSQPSQSQSSQSSQPSQLRSQSPLSTKSWIQRNTLPFVKTVVVTDTPSLSSQDKGARARATPVWSTIAYYEVTIVHSHSIPHTHPIVPVCISILSCICLIPSLQVTIHPPVPPVYSQPAYTSLSTYIRSLVFMYTFTGHHTPSRSPSII